MSTQVEFITPGDPVLHEVGRVVITHSHLDHVLRLAIKRLLGINIDDPIYKEETSGMSGVLRTKLSKVIKERLATQPEVATKLHTLLKEAQLLSDLRNELVHGLWARERGAKKAHIFDKRLIILPKVRELKRLEGRINKLHRALNRQTRPFL